jgi:cytochrome P450
MSGRVASAVRRVSTSLRRPWGGTRGPDEPPVVRGWVPFLGCALPFGRDAPSFLRRCQERHGDAFSLYLLGRRMTFLLDPRDYPLVVKHAHALSFTPIAQEISTRAFGYRSVYTSGLTEAQMRETYARHLRPGSLGPLVEGTRRALADAIAQQVAALPEGEGGWRELDLLDFVSRCLFMAGVVAMFGRGPVDAALHDTFRRYDGQFGRLAAGVPMRLLGTVRQDREALVEQLRPAWPDASGFITERRALLLRYVDEEEAARVRLSMLWASQANTIPAGFWALALLLEHPAALAAIRTEIDRAVARDEAGPLEQPRLDSAIKEVLRLSTGAITIRTVLEPVTLELVGGQRCALRPGDNVAVYPYLSHRDPEVFEDPEVFRFDRFFSERGAKQFQKGGQRLGFALMPFGGGETMCPGRFLAQSGIKLLVTMMLADYELELVPGQSRPAFDLSRSGTGILPPAESLRVRLRTRKVA